jgi:hypothetical protein
MRCNIRFRFQLQICASQNQKKRCGAARRNSNSETAGGNQKAKKTARGAQGGWQVRKAVVMCPKEAVPSDTLNAAGVVLMILAAGAELKQASPKGGWRPEIKLRRYLDFHGV